MLGKLEQSLVNFFLAIDQANHISFDVIATTLQCLQFKGK